MEEKIKNDSFVSKNYNRFLKIMKISLLMFVLFVSSLMAENIYSQHAEMSLKLKNVTLKKAISEIEKASNYVFLVTDDAQSELNYKTSIHVTKESLKNILETIFNESGLTYNIVERQVSVYKDVSYKPRAVVEETKINIAQQQKKKITGQIVDEEGEPVIGANIMEKGTTNGIVTDYDGNFALNVDDNAVLQITYIGYVSQDVSTVGKTTVDVVLAEDTQSLEEVVVTGYQEVRRDRMTGSVSTIRSSDIKNLNIKSMDQVFSGTISGLSAITSGRPGEDARIQIRGINSLTGNTEPIWIIDGMPLQGETPNLTATGGDLSSSLFQSGIGNISPDDIESITVLKDAAASAIYGARAANGVIVVKTKSGQAGAPRYNITTHFGVNERPRNNIQMMNSEEKIKFEKETYYDHELTVGHVSEILRQVAKGVITQSEADKQIEALGNINTDWFSELYRPSLSLQINANMSGGSEKTQYYNSLNYLSDNGTEYNNVYKRFRFSTKLDHSFSSKLKFQTELAGTYRQDKRTAAAFDVLSYAMYANPYETPDGYDQSWDMSRSNLHDGYRWKTFNAKNEISNNTASSQFLDIALRVKLDWELTKSLNFSSQGIINGNSNNTRTIEGENTYTNFTRNWLNFIGDELSPEQVRGSLNEGVSQASSYTFRNTFEYKLNIDDTHYLDIFGGQEISDRVNYVSSNYSPIFDQQHRITGFPELPEGTDLKSINFTGLGRTGRFQSKLSSFFLNGNYSFQDRYVASGSVRYDGSDIIGNNNQFTPLWNVSGRWNLHNEKYFKSDLLNALSLRAGYGFTGSIDKNAFPFVLTQFGSSITYDGATVPTSFQFANPNVRWQTKEDFNIGIETSFLKNRFNLSVNYYNNLVFDLLDQRSLPLSSGRPSVTENVADVLNKGWEIDMGANIFRNRDFSWNIRGSVAFNENIIKKTFYKGTEYLPSVGSGNNSYFVQGYPVRGWFGYRFAEVDPISGHTMVYDNNGDLFDMDLLSNLTLGLEAPEPVFLGDFYPPIIGGFSNTLTWKRWVMTMSFEFKAGNHIQSFSTFRSLSTRNRHAADDNRWRAPGDIAAIPSISTSQRAYYTYMYDAMLEKGDYLRNTYTSLGYNVPPSLTKSLGFQSARVTFNINNLFTFTAYKGIDPALMGGIGYPNSRKYNLTLNIGF